jgi:hypothetical protein
MEAVHSNKAILDYEDRTLLNTWGRVSGFSTIGVIG